MLSAPTVLPTPGPDPDYNTPDNHFNMENAPQQFVYGFDQDVTVAPDALTVTNLTSGNVFTDFTESGTSDSHTWSVNAAGSYGETYALLQGNYEANLNSDFVTNGNREKLNGGVDDITSSFYLPGDANHDRVVNADDYFYIEAARLRTRSHRASTTAISTTTA